MRSLLIMMLFLAQLAISSRLNAGERRKMEMVAIPGGTFTMGTRVDLHDEDWNNAALPLHVVTLKPFLMDKYEVTQGEYKKLMGKNPLATKKNLEITRKLKEDKNFKPIWPIILVGDDYPVDNVSWCDAARFCNLRSKAEGLEPCYDEKTWKCDFTKNGYRLPTEAEWEYACRAGSATKYFFGNDKKKLIEYTNYWPYEDDWYDAFYKNGWYDPNGVVWNKPMAKLLPVGSKIPNKWGLYDMLGNVFEWCNDWYDDNYYKKSPKKNPRGPEKGEDKVIRGHCFHDGDAPCTYRDCSRFKSGGAGFRCVRNASKEEKKESTINLSLIILINYYENAEADNKSLSYGGGVDITSVFDFVFQRDNQLDDFLNGFGIVDSPVGGVAGVLFCNLNNALSGRD